MDCPYMGRCTSARENILRRVSQVKHVIIIYWNPDDPPTPKNQTFDWFNSWDRNQITWISHLLPYPGSWQL